MESFDKRWINLQLKLNQGAVAGTIIIKFVTSQIKTKVQDYSKGTPLEQI
jgi:hypothetical protein